MKKYTPTILFPFLIAAVFLAGGCAQQPAGKVYVKDGIEYGKTSGYIFRHKWWNYYERGISYAEGEFYEDAIGDFTQAINQRPGDQRMARTYGMHFIDYFPHRELGIIHYQRGDLAAAREELELSLSQYPSAKARFYLDRVRKALLEQEAKEVPPPRLTLSFTADEIWTRKDPVVVSGVAEDEAYVAAIAVRGVPFFLDGSEKRIHFEQKLTLPQGRHTVQVEAENLLGKVTQQQVVIHVDRVGPLIILDELSFDPGPNGLEIRINGLLYDASGVSDLVIDGQTIPIRKGVEVPFSHKLITRSANLVIVARDRLGNQVSADIPIVPDSARHLPVLFASLDSGGAASISLVSFALGDDYPPEINLKDWTDRQTVYLKKVYLDGYISDNSRVASLTINQIPILLRHSGRIIFFSHFAELAEGKNTIIIEARDVAGNSAKKEIIVIRRVPQALQLSQRMSLTVFPFDQKGEVAKASLAFQDNLTDALVNRNRFRVVERDKLDMILEEQKLSRTKLVDERTAIKLGRLVAAQSFITGSIIESRTGIEVLGRLIDTETSEILATMDVYDEAKDVPALRSLAEGMAVKFHREFPLVDGLVIERKQKHIFTDLGKDAIKLQRRLIVFRQEPMKHPVTGKVIGADNIIIGHARVTQVMSEMSKAELLDDKIESITRLDRVITE